MSRYSPRVSLSVVLLSLVACHVAPSTTQPTAEHRRAAPPEDWPAAKEQTAAAETVQAQGPAASEDKAPSTAEPTRDRFSVGTVNLDWAFDEIDDRSEVANARNAPTEADWDWKVAAIGKILIERDLDLVAVQSIGGRRELIDIVHYVLANGGPNYDVAYVEGTDRLTGQQVALLSKFLVHDARRADIAVTKHLIADVMLPDYTQLVVVTAQLRSGRYGSQTAFRRDEARRLRREVDKLRASGPVLVLGDIGSHYLPENEGYEESAPGTFAGVHTRDKADDCYDSGESYLAQVTDINRDATARMFFCGVKPDIDRFDVIGEMSMIRGTFDDPKMNRWDIPADERDISSSYLLTAEVVLRARSADDTSP